MPSASSSSSIAKPLLRTSARLASSESTSVIVWPVRGRRPVCAHRSRTCCSVIVARIAFPAAEACGISRWPSGVWNRTLPGPSTRSMKTGNPSSQIASREVIFVRSASSTSSGRLRSPSGSWPRAMSPSLITRGAERVPGAGPAVAQHPEAGQRPRQRQRRALRRPELPGQVAERQALGRPVGDDLHQPHRPGHAADGVAAGVVVGPAPPAASPALLRLPALWRTPRTPRTTSTVSAPCSAGPNANVRKR